MSNIDKKDVDILLNKWYETKKEISELEKKLEKYKKYAKSIMEDTNSDEIKSSKFTLKRKNNNKIILSKKDVPPEIYKRYASTSNFDMFTLKDNNKVYKKSI